MTPPSFGQCLPSEAPPIVRACLPLLDHHGYELHAACAFVAIARSEDACHAAMVNHYEHTARLA